MKRRQFIKSAAIGIGAITVPVVVRARPDYRQYLARYNDGPTRYYSDEWITNHPDLDIKRFKWSHADFYTIIKDHV